jgi:hypothetical protein
MDLPLRPNYRGGQLVVEYATVCFRSREDCGPKAKNERTHAITRREDGSGSQLEVISGVLRRSLIAIFIMGALPIFEANASTYLETLQVDADSTDSQFLRQLIEHNINVRKAEDGSFTSSLQGYYGEHCSIDVDLGTVTVELPDRWCFVNRDLQRRAKIMGLSYLIWHPEDRDVTVYIHDYKGMATESYFLHINSNGENAIWEEIDILTKEAGLDREPLNPVVRN